MPTWATARKAATRQSPAITGRTTMVLSPAIYSARLNPPLALDLARVTASLGRMVNSRTAPITSMGNASQPVDARHATVATNTPAMVGPRVSPRLAPEPCMAMAKPRRSENSLDK